MSQNTVQSLFRLQNLIGRNVKTFDNADAGHIDDVYFDDQTWQVRYLVVELGSWLNSKRVLLTPLAISDIAEGAISVSITEKLLSDSPDVDWAKPISRQYEIDLFNYYSWTTYWRPPLVPGDTGGMMVAPIPVKTDGENSAEKTDGDPHLRSFNEVINYDIASLDGNIGHLEDFIVNTDNWRLRYFVVDTSNWLPGRKVTLPPNWIDAIDWSTGSVSVDLSSETIENSPEVDLDQLNRDYEQRLYRHYKRTPYWEID